MIRSDCEDDGSKTSELAVGEDKKLWANSDGNAGAGADGDVVFAWARPGGRAVAGYEEGDKAGMAAAVNGNKEDMKKLA